MVVFTIIQTIPRYRILRRRRRDVKHEPNSHVKANRM